ncbi:hypothetical protein ODU73_002711 [Thermoclostridium stercorarium]|nr:hypothetical protein ODU73_002711 [Thermoclostridium stercorarium]
MKRIDAQMEEEASNYERLQELLKEKEELKAKLDILYEKWIELAEIIQ